MRILLLYTAGGCICLAQSLSVGAIGGIRLTDDIRSGQINASTSGQISVAGGTMSESRRYVVGPAVEIGLPFRLALEFDALYRREGYRTDLRVSIPPSVNPFGPFGGTQFDRARANSWEFPLLLKYKIPLRVIKPYVEVGTPTGLFAGPLIVIYSFSALPQHRVVAISDHTQRRIGVIAWVRSRVLGSNSHSAVC